MYHVSFLPLFDINEAATLLCSVGIGLDNIHNNVPENQLLMAADMWPEMVC